MVVTIIVLILPGESNGVEIEIGSEIAFCEDSVMSPVMHGKFSGCYVETYSLCRPGSFLLERCHAGNAVWHSGEISLKL